MKIQEAYQTAKVLAGLALATFMGCGSDYQPMPTEPAVLERKTKDAWILDGTYELRDDVPRMIHVLASKRKRLEGTEKDYVDLSREIAEAMDDNKDRIITTDEAEDFNSRFERKLYEFRYGREQNTFASLVAEESQNE